MQQKFASVLGNHAPSVRKADLGDKGVWYRLMVGPLETKADADQLCEQLKTAGMKGCFSRKE
jgi:cell division protein FtsN